MISTSMVKNAIFTIALLTLVNQYGGMVREYVLGNRKLFS